MHIKNIFTFAIDYGIIYTSIKKAANGAKTLLCVGVALSLCPLIFGIRFFSVTGALITLLLAAEFALLCFMK